MASWGTPRPKRTPKPKPAPKPKVRDNDARRIGLITKPERPARRPRGTDDPSDRSPVSNVPAISAEIANTLAKFLISGIPPYTAVRRVLPGINPEVVPEIWRAWAVSERLVAAVNELNGGTWEDLDRDRRLSVSLDQSRAQMAYFLQTTSFASLDGPDLKKYELALTTIRASVDGQIGERGDAIDVFTKFLAEVVTGRASLQMPPQLPESPTDDDSLMADLLATLPDDTPPKG